MPLPAVWSREKRHAGLISQTALWIALSASPRAKEQFSLRDPAECAIPIMGFLFKGDSIFATVSQYKIQGSGISDFFIIPDEVFRENRDAGGDYGIFLSARVHFFDGHLLKRETEIARNLIPGLPCLQSSLPPEFPDGRIRLHAFPVKDQRRSHCSEVTENEASVFLIHPS